MEFLRRSHILRLTRLIPEYDVDETARRLRKREQQVKRALARPNAGVGDWQHLRRRGAVACSLHFARATDRLTKPQAVSVLDEARSVMDAALMQGGTSFDELYVNVNGESGYFERSLEVYGREGLPCSRCGRPIRRVGLRQSFVVLLPALPGSTTRFYGERLLANRSTPRAGR